MALQKATFEYIKPNVDEIHDWAFSNLWCSTTLEICSPMLWYSPISKECRVRRLPINWPVFGCAYPITTMPTFVRMLSQYGFPNIHCLRYINTLSYGGVWLLLVFRKFDELIKGMIYQVNFCQGGDCWKHVNEFSHAVTCICRRTCMQFTYELFM